MHACALSITHALFGVPLPNQTDLYDIGGLDRSIVKSLDQPFPYEWQASSEVG